MQVKPPLVEGEMSSFDIETAPAELLEGAAYIPERCNCGAVLMVLNENEGWVLRVARDIPISRLPLRVEWTERKAT